MPVTGYILVYTTSSAFKSEKALKSAGIETKLVPTPRQFSSDCGISVYFESVSVEIVKKILDTSNIEYIIEGVK